MYRQARRPRMQTSSPGSSFAGSTTLTSAQARQGLDSEIRISSFTVKCSLRLHILDPYLVFRGSNEDWLRRVESQGAHAIKVTSQSVFSAPRLPEGLLRCGNLKGLKAECNDKMPQKHRMNSYGIKIEQTNDTIVNYNSHRKRSRCRSLSSAARALPIQGSCW